MLSFILNEIYIGPPSKIPREEMERYYTRQRVLNDLPTYKRVAINSLPVTTLIGGSLIGNSFGHPFLGGLAGYTSGSLMKHEYLNSLIKKEMEK